MKNFHDEYNRTKDIFEKKMLTMVGEAVYDAPEILTKAMRYSLEAGGKRIRPVLMLQVAQLFGTTLENVFPLAVALEFIHTYSLIHDDLPCMDNDELRRGKPTNHIVFGEDMALLAGDGLLNLAMETALKGIENLKEDHLKAYLQAMGILFTAAGVNGMIGGQGVDLLSENKDIDEETLHYIHTHKTGALINAAVLCGGTLAKIDEKTYSILQQYSDVIGLAFQIRDDILDVEGDPEIVGKALGSDLANKKTTYVTHYGLQESERKLKKLEEEGIRLMNQLDCDTSFLETMIRYICQRNQ